MNAPDARMRPATGRSISFLLPGPGHSPVGGFKVVYEYASGLALRGHETHVVHVAELEPAGSLTYRAKARLGYYRRSLSGWRPDSWFRFRAPVHLHWIPRLDARRLPATEVYVATAWQTADWLGQSSLPRRPRRMYLIQSDETWAGDRTRVRRTWTLPLDKIVIARWLEDLCLELGQPCTRITNGLDFDAFGLDLPIESRAPATVLALWHEHPGKASRLALEVLRATHARRADLTATFFGLPEAPRDLPSFARYARNPEQSHLRRLYNEHAVYLSASFVEGWSLTGAEAMMCGTAFVGTDIGGHRDYAIEGETALLAPSGDANALGLALERVLADPPLRMRLARAGNERIRQHTWTSALDHFERCLGWSA